MLTRPVLLWDGRCGFCRRWVRRLQHWDGARRLDYVAAADRHRIAGLPPIADRSLDEAMHFVTPDGEAYAGSAALGPILGYLPGGNLLRWVLVLPGVPWMADRTYRWVARHRHELGCEVSLEEKKEPVC